MENDGKIILNFLDDDFEVRGDFYPPVNGGAPISPDYIHTLLAESRILHGVNTEEIDKAYKECNEAGIPVRDVLVARGERPVNEILEYMQINPALGQSCAPVKSDDDTVDHRSRSPFIIVKKGEALAKQKHRKNGRDGMNVHGETIGYGVVRPDGVTAGENTRMEGRYLLAEISGQFVEKKGEVSVRSSLIINGPVGYTTGNIMFPGDVEIEGPVSDGFKIYSGGSVTIKQTFDVTDAIIKNDLSVAGGIIGRGMALIKTGGTLKTKFIDNCRVACRKTVAVDLEIVNSHVFTLETLEMGDKGQIVGGEIHAVKGVRTGRIGKKTGKAASIYCGVDFTLEQEKEKNNGVLRILAAKLNRLRELMADPQTGAAADEEKKAKMETLLRRLEDEQQKVQAKVSELLGKLNSFKDAVVEVKGEIVTGTLIEICQSSLYVTEPLKRVRIRLDRENNKLVTEKL